MNFKKYLFILAILVVNVAFAQLSNPIFDQRQWKIGFAKQSKTDSIKEYVLKSETIEHWSELVTVQFFPGLQDKIDLETFANTTKKSITQICPEVAWETIAKTKNESIWFFVIKDCQGQLDQSEIARVVITKKGIHVFHYANKKSPMSLATKQTWLQNLKAIQVSR